MATGYLGIPSPFWVRNCQFGYKVEAIPLQVGFHSGVYPHCVEHFFLLRFPRSNFPGSELDGQIGDLNGVKTA
jgi:hypothetical protein